MKPRRPRQPARLLLIALASLVGGCLCVSLSEPPRTAVIQAIPAPPTTMSNPRIDSPDTGSVPHDASAAVNDPPPVVDGGGAIILDGSNNILSTDTSGVSIHPNGPVSMSNGYGVDDFDESALPPTFTVMVPSGVSPLANCSIWVQIGTPGFPDVTWWHGYFDIGPPTTDYSELNRVFGPVTISSVGTDHQSDLETGHGTPGNVTTGASDSIPYSETGRLFGPVTASFAGDGGTAFAEMARAVPLYAITGAFDGSPYSELGRSTGVVIAVVGMNGGFSLTESRGALVNVLTGKTDVQMGAETGHAVPVFVLTGNSFGQTYMDAVGALVYAHPGASDSIGITQTGRPMGTILVVTGEADNLDSTGGSAGSEMVGNLINVLAGRTDTVHLGEILPVLVQVLTGQSAPFGSHESAGDVIYAHFEEVSDRFNPAERPGILVQVVTGGIAEMGPVAYSELGRLLSLVHVITGETDSRAMQETGRGVPVVQVLTGSLSGRNMSESPAGSVVLVLTGRAAAEAVAMGEVAGLPVRVLTGGAGLRDYTESDRPTVVLVTVGVRDSEIGDLVVLCGTRLPGGLLGQMGADQFAGTRESGAETIKAAPLGCC